MSAPERRARTARHVLLAKSRPVWIPSGRPKVVISRYMAQAVVAATTTADPLPQQPLGRGRSCAGLTLKDEAGAVPVYDPPAREAPQRAGEPGILRA